MTSRRRLSRVLVAVVFVAASCGVPTDRDPRAISEDSLPAALSSTSTTIVVEDPLGIEVDLFLIGEDGRLQAIQRPLPRPVETLLVLETLISTADDETLQEQLLRSSIPSSTVVAGLDVVDSILIIDFGPEGFAELEAEQQFQALAQIVYTATGLETVDGVLLRIEGELRPLPTDGEPTEGQQPVTRQDYASLA